MSPNPMSSIVDGSGTLVGAATASVLALVSSAVSVAPARLKLDI